MKDATDCTDLKPVSRCLSDCFLKSSDYLAAADYAEALWRKITQPAKAGSRIGAAQPSRTVISHVCRIGNLGEFVNEKYLQSPDPGCAEPRVMRFTGTSLAAERLAQATLRALQGQGAF